MGVHEVNVPMMKRTLIYISILLDIGVFVMMDVLNWMFGTNKDSFEAFQKFKTVVVPTRNGYLIATAVVNFIMVIYVLGTYFKGSPEQRHLTVVEWIGMVVVTVMVLLFVFVYYCVPTGPFF